jgi:glucokinase
VRAPGPSLGVLDVGGTHVTAARVDPQSWQLAGRPHRVDIDAHADADELLTGIAAAADGMHEPMWAIAMPDPFDYERGIGRFHGVGKFEALDGVDVRGELARRLGRSPDDLHFCNDADAFTVGEWLAGAARGSARVVGLTLGTGVGSGWVADGRVVVPDVPPGGRAHRLTVHGRPLEDSMSRRAIRRAYAEATGDRDADVREIASLARNGDDTACAVLAEALRALGAALAAPIRDFAADVIVLGGSMSASWALFEPWFRQGADGAGVPPVRIAADAAAAPLLGAAYVAVEAVTPSR